MTDPLADECRALAEALRRLRLTLHRRLLYSDDVTPATWPAVSAVLCSGAETAAALEVLAGLLDEAGPTARSSAS
jgi:hypothetical protein